jgi:putative peptidoglycan lipid II flippase
MKRTAFIIMFITLISKVLGFLREITLSYFYGASHISDAYIIAFTIPNVIFSFVGAAISTTYIPIYNEILSNDSKKKADEFTNNLLNFLIIIGLILVVFVIIFAENIVGVFASGFGGETLNIAIDFTRISILAILFNIYIYIYKSYLHIRNNFKIPAMIGLPFNLILITTIVLSKKTSLIVLASGITLSIISQFLFLTPFVKKENLGYEFILNIKDKYLKKMFNLSIPIILGTSVNQINVLVDRTLASRITVGGISALNYANKLNVFVQGVVVVSVVTVMYPLMSKRIVDNDIQGLKKYLSESVSIVNLLVVPMIFGTILFSKPLIQFLFARGAFDRQALDMTTNSLVFYSIGMLGFGLRRVFSKTFYAMNNTKVPMINAAIGMLINIILNIVLSRYMGLHGLALATSISAMATTFLLALSLRNNIGPFGIKKIIISFGKILFASVIMGLITKISFVYLSGKASQTLSLFLTIFIGIIIYSAVIYFIGINEVDDIIKIIKKRYLNKENDI